jgi:citrate lyase subunit beta/citryl-CoA lyase
MTVSLNDPFDPRLALFDDGDAAPSLPVCDHYAGVEVRMRKSLALQARRGPVFDVTLDCEDGAPVGREREHAELVADLLLSDDNRHGRVGARVHPVDHPSFAADLETLIGRAGDRLAYLMLPKPRDAQAVSRAIERIDQIATVAGRGRQLPVQVLIETHGALYEVDAIAAHPRVESLSFGLMDFVSAHRGAIPASAMGAVGQFQHPLIVRAKLEIAAACHRHAKVPSHCVVTEIADADAVRAAARRASSEFGYTRMWSIHPDQIEPIIDAMAPAAAEVAEAAEILLAAADAHWAPIRHRDTLHDRASYRYYWQLLDRAHRTGRRLPDAAVARWFQT